jgi:hypothetical protein
MADAGRSRLQWARTSLRRRLRVRHCTCIATASGSTVPTRRKRLEPEERAAGIEPA